MPNVTKIEHISETVPTKIKVAAYARVSMDSDRLAHSLSTQVSYYSDLIQSNPKWEFAGIFADFGITGTDVRRRDDFNKMLAACDNGEINLILTKSISRFARNTVDLLNTVRHLKDIGVEVRFEKENLSTFSSECEVLLSLMGTFAEEESRSTSNNIKWAIQKGFEKGKPRAIAPFGYRWNGEKFVVDEHEAVAVRKIFDDFLSDIPMAHTAKWLEENGYKSHTKQFVIYALQNIVYTGNLLLQRYYTISLAGHVTKKNEGELPKYYVENSHEAIISQEIFDAVQRKMRESYEFNPEAHRRVKPKCFSSKIKCGCCGGNYVSTPRRGERTHEGLVEAWSCFVKVKSRKKNCQNGVITGAELRRISSEIMGTEAFDEYEFTHTIKQITIYSDGKMIYEFYNGRKESAQTHFFKTEDRKYKDPHLPIYGYKWTKDGYVIYEPEAEGVRLVYKLYNDGMTISDISRKMESLGYKSKRGKFTRKIVLYILQNPFYIGTRIFPAHYSGTGKEETVLNDHEPIVTLHAYEQAKERREKDAKRHNDSRNNRHQNIGTDSREPKA